MDNTLLKLVDDFIGMLNRLAVHKDQNFSGAGFVLYDELTTLSKYHCNLVEQEQDMPTLMLGTPGLVDYLMEISHYQHPYHDGFHFINKHGVLTHVAQFFSPPVYKFAPEIKGQGARTYCSQCGSKIDGVIMIGSISSKRHIHLFKKGKSIPNPVFNITALSSNLIV